MRKHLFPLLRNRQLRPPQDFIADPVNPNIDGLLDNIKRSYTAVVDQYGTFYLFMRSKHLHVAQKAWSYSSECVFSRSLMLLKSAMYFSNTATDSEVAVRSFEELRTSLWVSIIQSNKTVCLT